MINQNSMSAFHLHELNFSMNLKVFFGRTNENKFGGRLDKNQLKKKITTEFQNHFNFILRDLFLFRITMITKTAAAQLNAIVTNVIIPLTPAFPMGMLALSDRFE